MPSRLRTFQVAFRRVAPFWPSGRETAPSRVKPRGIGGGRTRQRVMRQIVLHPVSDRCIGRKRLRRRVLALPMCGKSDFWQSSSSFRRRRTPPSRFRVAKLGEVFRLRGNWGPIWSDFSTQGEPKARRYAPTEDQNRCFVKHPGGGPPLSQRFPARCARGTAGAPGTWAPELRRFRRAARDDGPLQPAVPASSSRRRRCSCLHQRPLRITLGHHGAPPARRPQGRGR